MPIQTINDVALHYDESGNHSKPSLIFTGSLLFGAGGFDALIPMLENNFHIVRLDVHGHGQSGVRVPLILEEMAEDFYELLSRLDLREPVWVGHSIGGMLGLRIVCKHPDFFSALVLIAALARLDPPDLREQTWQLWEAFSRGPTNHDCRRGAPILLCQSDFSRAARADSTKSRPDPQLSGCGECFPERPRGFRTNRLHGISAAHRHPHACHRWEGGLGCVARGSAVYRGARSRCTTRGRRGGKSPCPFRETSPSR